jgi:nucleoside-diphosphate-sugar epimerase
LAVSKVVGTVKLLISCAESRKDRFAGSAAVYASSSESLTEDGSDLRPEDVYSLSTLLAEQFVRCYRTSTDSYR